jgi:hypothetical protein
VGKVPSFTITIKSRMNTPIAAWLYSLKHYLLMSVFLSSPDRLPNSNKVIAINILAYFSLGLALIDENRSFETVSLLLVIEIIMLAAIFYAGLLFVRKPLRFIQSYSAALGVNLILTAISIPIYDIILTMRDEAGNVSQLGISLEFLLIFWSLSVLSLILKRTFECSTVFAAMISFNYFLVYQLIAYGIL